MYRTLLEQCALQDEPIRVGIIGAGKFGAGVVAQLSQMQGIEASLIADLDLDRARYAYTASDVAEDDIREAGSLGEAEQAILEGRPAVTQDGLMLTQCDLVDVVVEATGIPPVGARMAYSAITHHKHVIMVNVEADVTVGPILSSLAHSAGVVYTLVDGDQPGSTMNIVEWAKTLGFEIVAAGRGTIFYGDDRQGTPDTVPQRFGFSDEMLVRRTINLKMYNSFRDGSKAQIEMTALANAAGLVPDVRGMHEPSVNLADIPVHFSLVEEGGLLSQHGVVELANSIAEDGVTMLENPIRMGVFCVIRSEHPFIMEDLASYYVHTGGEGKNFLLWRPYHLVTVPAPISILKAVFDGQPTGAAQHRPTAEAITVAKRDLESGEVLDGSGGYTVNVLCEKAAIARAENLLPMGLSSGARLKQAVAQGTAITYDMVDLDEESFVLKLRRMQDATIL
jgi:predicted homoserine dehydrogenase-like protein